MARKKVKDAKHQPSLGPKALSSYKIMPAGSSQGWAAEQLAIQQKENKKKAKKRQKRDPLVGRDPEAAKKNNARWTIDPENPANP